MPRPAQMIAVALLIASASAAAAQTAPAPPTAGSSAVGQLQPGQMRAMDYIDQDVHASDGSEVGEVEDLIIEGDRIAAAVIEVEGNLGIGERHVTVPISRLRADGDRLVLDMTREQIGALPTFQYRD